MSVNKRALIVDDDPDASQFLQYQLRKRFPQFEIEVRNQPDVSGHFDLFFLDNDFDGRRLAPGLARLIRTGKKKSLIFALSAYLDVETLKELINAGCDGVCEKANPAELEEFLGVVAHHVAPETVASKSGSTFSGIRGTVDSITELIREWNLRLDNNAMPHRDSVDATSGRNSS